MNEIGKLKLKITKVLESREDLVFAYLFGSRVKDCIRFGSDLDLALYFKTDPDILEIGGLVTQLELTVDIKIDIIKLNELPIQNPVLAYNILSEGILLFCKDITLANNYKKETLVGYFDFQPMHEKFNKRFLERLTTNNFAR
ncbi:MAG: hypothetical protein AUK34_00105 [Ignavibacteria bacterium CG2_30_36_16]|nr:nucleotidyltransferase domain-containing protein [Ignavibacteria bacterium]OIP64270.1 MAG: hypothetical protein AUK34_00105 [Ignavibacteria bacterium CG2_30_36_16]PJA99578.1 MAG: hypothetical protein CO127_10195 [Ignavibacteria bacterium CG_4_9_14_3_um_filter_36_18]